jgi:hypothetical protein
MNKYCNKYDMDDFQKWAIKFNERLKITDVVREFGADYSTVKKHLLKNKKDLGIVFKEDLEGLGKKFCVRCNKIKSIDEFNELKSSKDGKNYICAGCARDKGKKWYNDNIEYSREYKKKSSKKYRKENPEKVKDSKNKWRKNNAEKHKEGVRRRSKRYRENKKDDIQFKLRNLIRRRLRSLISRKNLTEAIDEHIGCSYSMLVEYLESMFYDNPETLEAMSWNNHSSDGWHIDHIIPLASFDLEDKEQFAKAIHYSNLQPLWAKENLSKGANVA